MEIILGETEIAEKVLGGMLQENVSGIPEKVSGGILGRIPEKVREFIPVRINEKKNVESLREFRNKREISRKNGQSSVEHFGEMSEFRKMPLKQFSGGNLVRIPG